ncbi:MAG: hypothetical protein IJU57_03175 [Clostridia bacterium]|nr:hypothetical protein [Clostridia bacterium]
MKAVWLKGLSEEKNVLASFRYICRQSGDLRIRLAASNLYRLFVNGELTGYGPARAAHGYTRTDEYTVEKAVPQDGELIITAEVYSAQVNNYYIVKEHAYFACEILSGGEIIAEADDFESYRITERVQKTRRYSFQRCFTEAYRLTGDPAGFRKGKGPAGVPWEKEEVHTNILLSRGVSYPVFELKAPDLLRSGSFETITKDPAEGYDYAEEDEKIGGFAVSELEEDLIAQADSVHCIEKTELTHFTGAIAGGQYATYDFGRTIAGFFRLDVLCSGLTELLITFDELIDVEGSAKSVNPFRNNTVNCVKYTLDPGNGTKSFDLLTFEAVSARYVQLSVLSGEVIIVSFRMVNYENPDAVRFEFDYGDPELNEIVRAAVNTYAQNAVDVPTDCPSRERAGWLCDSFFSSKAEKLFTGDNRVEKNFLENYILAPHLKELPPQMIPMCYPCDHANGSYIPNWSMWFVLELEDYLKRSGDRDLIDRAKNTVYGLIDFFDRYLNEYGLIENMDGWVFVEWSMCNTPEYIRGLNYPTNMLWADMLRAASVLYKDEKLLDRSVKIKNTVKEMAWNGRFFEDNAVRDDSGMLVKTGHTTETGQYYPFYFGVASPEEFPALFDLLINEFGPSRDFQTVYPDVHFANVLVGFHLRFGILMRHRLYDKVITECKKLFLRMARTTGTLWEHWSPHSSLNHAFEAVAAVYIDEIIENRIQHK